MLLLIADDSAVITWPHVGMAFVTALVTIASTVTPVIVTYLNLRNKIIDNTAKTQAAATASEDAAIKAEKARALSFVTAQTCKRMASSQRTDSDAIAKIQAQIDHQRSQIEAALADSKKTLLGGPDHGDGNVGDCNAHGSDGDRNSRGDGGASPDQQKS